MPVYDRFKVVKSAAFPAAYLIPADDRAVVELLRLHGIVVEQLVERWSGDATQFTIAEPKIASRPFQGHKLIQLDGAFSTISVEVPAGTYLVRTSQPLGILAFHVLEPESLDGAAAWGFLGPDFKAGAVFPIEKLMAPVPVPTVRVE
jgi:dipeptidyl-peptidase-4